MLQLEQFFGFAFTQGMLCARHSDRLAWIQTTRGVRNIFIASAPDLTPVQVTSWSRDDGQLLAALKIADDGSALIVIRGKGKNENEEYPNPLSEVNPPVQKLWYINLNHTGSGPRELAETGLASFRPGTREVYFTRKNVLFSLDTADEVAEPQKILSTRGNITELCWSEQGNQLALAVSRDKHGFIALYTPGQPTLQWLDPSFDRDCQITWSPSGDKIAFLRCHGPKPDIGLLWFSDFSDRFELRIADVASLHSKSYWLCPEGCGISLQEGCRPLLWLNNDELVFSHEASGYDHIYRVDTQAGNRKKAVTGLTSGNFIVHSYGLSRSSEWLYYTHNQNCPQGYSLARINLNNGEQEQLQKLLPENSITFFPAPIFSEDRIGLVLASSTLPLSPAILDPQTGDLIIHQQSDYQQLSQQLCDVEKTVLKAPDGLELYGQLFRPESPGPHPALLVFHGGPWCQTLAGFSNWHGLSYLYASCQYLAQQGYVVFSLNYRGSSGYGRAFRQPGPYFWKGACEYQDVLTAGYWLAEQQGVDPERIGVMGKSYGGYLTAMSLARNSNLFKAGVDIEGCHNIPRELRQPHWSSKLFTPEAGESLEEVQERSQSALESSPWNYLDSWSSPVLLIHPDDDRRVQFEESQALYHELRKRKVSVEAMVIPDEEHSFLRHQPWIDCIRRVTGFFQKHFLQKTR